MKGLGIWWERSRLCTVIVILLSLFREVTFAQVDVLQPSLKYHARRQDVIRVSPAISGRGKSDLLFES